MAHSIEHLIEPTEKGVKIELGTLYCYPDGHMHLSFADGQTDWPMKHPLEAVSIVVNQLLYPLFEAARKKEGRPR